MPMQRPNNFTLENYAEIYEYYRQYTPSAKKTAFAGNVLRLLYNPHTTISDNNLQTVIEHSESKQPFVYALNHVRVRDQFVVGSALWSVPEPRIAAVRGVIIPAKPSYFTGVSKLPLPTTLLEDVGMVPVFRTTEANGKDSSLFIDSTQAYLDTCAIQLARGINILVSPEGTRNTKDPTRIQVLKQGLAKTTLLACELGVEPMILPTAVYYTGEKFGFYKPHVHIGEPFKPEMTDNASAITTHLQHNLQHALDTLTQKAL